MSPKSFLLDEIDAAQGPGENLKRFEEAEEGLPEPALAAVCRGGAGRLSQGYEHRQHYSYVVAGATVLDCLYHQGFTY